MIILLISLLILLCGILFFIIKKNKELKKENNKNKEKIYKEVLEEKENEINKKLSILVEQKRELNFEISNSQVKLENLKNLLNERIENFNNTLSQEQNIIDKSVNSYRELKLKEVEKDLEEYFLKNKEEKEKELFLLESKNKKKINILVEEKENLEKILETYKEKRNSINAAILREKELEEKKDFYRVVVEEKDIKDIKLLYEIEPKLNNKEALNKLIYEVFIRRPAAEMIKRVLSGRNPSGIYKITYILTGESYIGKSTDVSKRWTEHIKSSLNIGTIAHSSLHSKMAQCGLWNFTFELLEEVPKDNLTEREKYYIDFYGTKKMGLNQKDG